MKLYLANLRLWFRYTKQMIATRSYRSVGGGTFWGQVLLLQILDRGTNTLAGGDPVMTLSGRLYRDRHDNAIAHFFNSLANFFFTNTGRAIKTRKCGAMAKGQLMIEIYQTQISITPLLLP